MCAHLAFSKILNGVRLADRPEANAVTLNLSLTSGSRGLGWYPKARNIESEDALWSQPGLASRPREVHSGWVISVNHIIL